MQLTVREVAELLQVDEKIVYRWVSEDGLPAEQVNGQYRFNRTELLEWATVHKITLSPALFKDAAGSEPSQVRLDQALEAGGIFYDVMGSDKESVLRAMLSALPLPEDFDRAFLLQVFLSREALGSTGIGDGLAIPHPRFPVVLPVPRASITLCFLAEPIAYSAIDQQPVHTLFALISPTVPIHLQLLARLSYALRKPEFRQAVRTRSSREAILAEARRIEVGIDPSGPDTGKENA
jgi:PTS system nitrogen regulatory IIA component